jgi:hypothetical protein
MGRIGDIPKSQLYARTSFSSSDGKVNRNAMFEEESSYVDEAAMADAAEAVREVELDAAEAEAEGQEIPDVSQLNKEKLLHMNIDELRAVAKQLDVPERESITDQDELVAAIQKCL